MKKGIVHLGIGKMKYKEEINITSVENIKKYNTARIDITKYMYSDDFTLSNYLNDKKVVALISLGVPCGAIQPTYKGKDLLHREEHLLSDEQLEQVKQEYVPINTLEELAEHKATHFCSYTINPNYIEPKKVQTFMYRFELLTDQNMTMFNLEEVNKHQIELLNDIPLTYEKLEKMRHKYITPDKEKEYIEKNRPRGIIVEGFYAWLDGNKTNSNETDKENKSDEETEEFE